MALGTKGHPRELQLQSDRVAFPECSEPWGMHCGYILAVLVLRVFQLPNIQMGPLKGEGLVYGQHSHGGGAAMGAG